MKNLTRLILLALLISAILVIAVLLLRRRYAAAADGPTLVLDFGGGTKLELVRIEPGEFQMGSPDDEPGHDPSESPRHLVKIDRPYYIGRFEVTQGQWQAVMNYNQAQLKGEPDQPVDSVSWSDAQKFCKFASERFGRSLRLPSEAEWEYACRAGTTTPFAFGDKLTKADAVFNWSKSDPSIASPEHPLKGGSGKANAWGLYDMHGNLWEWCEDGFTTDYSKHPGTQAAVPASGGEPDYVYRGGSWRSSAEECRSAVRFAGSAELRSEVMGFRVAVDARGQ